MLIKPSVSLYDLCGHGQVSQFHIYVVRFLSVIALVRAFSGHCEMLMSIFCIFLKYISLFQTSTRVVLEVVSWMGTELWLHSVDKSLHSYPRNLEAWNYYLVKTANQINYHFNNLNFVQTSSRQENSQRRRDKEYYEATSEASKTNFNLFLIFSFQFFTKLFP